MECVNPPMPEKKKTVPKKVEKDLKKAKKAAADTPDLKEKDHQDQA